VSRRMGRNPHVRGARVQELHDAASQRKAMSAGGEDLKGLEQRVAALEAELAEFRRLFEAGLEKALDWIADVAAGGRP